MVTGQQTLDCVEIQLSSAMEPVSCHMSRRASGTVCDPRRRYLNHMSSFLFLVIFVFLFLSGLYTAVGGDDQEVGTGLWQSRGTTFGFGPAEMQGEVRRGEERRGKPTFGVAGLCTLGGILIFSHATQILAREGRVEKKERKKDFWPFSFVLYAERSTHNPVPSREIFLPKWDILLSI